MHNKKISLYIIRSFDTI